jgi:hypothetical protein
VATDRFGLFQKVSFNNWGFEGRPLTAFGWRYGIHLYILDGENDRSSQEKEAVIFLISPTFFGSGNRFHHNPRLLLERRLTLSLEELRNIQEAKVEIQ